MRHFWILQIFSIVKNPAMGDLAPGAFVKGGTKVWDWPSGSWGHYLWPPYHVIARPPLWGWLLEASRSIFSERRRRNWLQTGKAVVLKFATKFVN